MKYQPLRHGFGHRWAICPHGVVGAGGGNLPGLDVLRDSDV